MMGEIVEMISCLQFELSCKKEIHIVWEHWIKPELMLSITEKWMAGFICVCICNVIVAIFIHAGKVVCSPLAFIYMVVFRQLNGRA